MRPTVTCTKCGKQGDYVFFEHLCSDGEMHGGIHMNYSNLTGETEIDNRKLRELVKQLWVGIQLWKDWEYFVEDSQDIKTKVQEVLE